MCTCKLRYLVLYVLFVSGRCTDDIVSLYEKLIDENIAAAKNYKLEEDAYSYSAHNNSVKNYGTFDFIIVGAGSAGAVIANRLSEIKHWNILLLEAGNYGNNFTDIPAMMYVTLQTPYNWGYKSTPQKTACLALENSTCPYPRGRGIGGTTLINGLVYSRGSRADFDKWAAMGNFGWSYEDVLPYFKKSEDFHKIVQDVVVDRPFHGKEGYLNVEYYRSRSEEASAFIKALKELDINLIDYNGASIEGTSPTQLNTKLGRRVDTNHAFIEPVRNRPNLHISTNSYITKLLIDQKKTFGVEFVKDGQMYQALINKEVILSSGAIGSPQILMNSGIGPREHLQDHNITVEANLSVGSTLRDHTVVSYPVCFTPSNNHNISLHEIIEEYLEDIGYLTLPISAEVLAFIQTSIEKTPLHPDVEVVISPINNLPAVPLEEFKYRKDFLVNPNCTYFDIAVVGLHTNSYGTVRLQSNSPFDYPLIDTNFFTDPENMDIETLYEGSKMLEKLLNTRAFQNINATVVLPNLKECANSVFPSKEYILCYIKYYSISAYHPVGTCPMGMDAQKGAVVDPYLRVFGVENLRVADASIFPTTLSGHSNAPSIMVGEKASDLIKASHYKLS